MRDDARQHCPQIQIRAYSLTNLSQSFQFFHRSTEIGCAGLQLLEQMDVLYCNDRLVRKGCNKFDLTVRKRLHHISKNNYRTEGYAISEQRNCKYRPRSVFVHGPAEMRLIVNIPYMDRFPFSNSPRSCAFLIRP